MNSQEREALQDFLHELVRARVQHKDPEAEAMILRAVSNVPDAPYLLVQRVLLQEQALNAARQQIASMQRRLESALPHDGFLNPTSDWGHSEFRTHPSHAGHHPGSAYRHGEPRRYFDSHMVRPGLMGGGAGSFLGTMAGVAAGVAAGSFLYHGIDDLLHHDHEGGDGRQEFADMSGESVPPERFAGDAGWDSGDRAGDAGIDDVGLGDGSGDFL